MPEEVVPASSQVPHPQGATLPTRLHPLAQQIQQLGSDDRRKLLKSFGAAQQGTGAQVPMQHGHVFEASFWQGATPPANELAKIEEIIPGGAERFLIMAEKQQQHRFDLETKVVTEQLSQSRSGQVFALTIGLAGLICAAFVAHLGHPASAASIATVALGTLAVTFIIGKQQEKQSRENKK